MLDSEGNIDTNRLEKELRNALDFDIKYKQTDNMKKKACKVAGSYDEFKAMVQCAHLKTLNRKEIESLKSVKKGWTKTAPLTCSHAHILNAESKSEITVSGLDLSSELRKPKTPNELERDWRRLPHDLADKLRYIDGSQFNVSTSDLTVIYCRYLKIATPKRTVALIESSGNAELMEAILLTLKDWSSCQSSTPCDQNATAISSDVESIPELHDQPQQPNVELFSYEEAYKWLKRISTMRGFDLMVRFTAQDLRCSLAQWIKTSEKEGCIELSLKYSTP